MENLEFNNSQPIKTWEELLSEKRYSILDTSFVSGLIKKNRDYKALNTLEEKIHFLENNNNFISNLTDCVLNGSKFFTTKYIIDEISNSYYNYKKVIKRAGSSKNKSLLELRRMIFEMNKKRRGLAEAFTFKNRVLSFDNKRRKYFEYLFMKFSKLGKQYGLSNADYDFFISGLVFAKKGRPVILLSNDHGILLFRNRLFRKNYITQQDMEFLARVDFFEFMIMNTRRPALNYQQL